MPEQTLNPTRTALAAATELAPLLDARAQEAERLRTLPADLVDEIRGAGLFGLATPRALGGAELPPATIVEVLERLCQADGSAGWCVLIGNATAFLAWLDPAVAGELLAGRAGTCGSAVFAPNGQLRPVAQGRFRLDGSWSFVSGCLHADWFFGGALVTERAGPRMLPGRGPDWRMAVLRTPDTTITDNWEAAGLRGTGSHDVSVAGLPVPEEHTAAVFFEPARHDGPLWRLPFFTLIGVLMAGLPLGVGRRALDELAELARTKVRRPGPGPLAEDADLQVALTRAEGGLRAARALVFESLGALWDTACAGDVPADAQRALFLLATQQAMRAALEAVDTAFGLAGASATRADHPLQRCFRDLHTAAAHIYFAPVSAKRYARNHLGLDQPTFWF